MSLRAAITRIASSISCSIENVLFFFAMVNQLTHLLPLYHHMPLLESELSNNFRILALSAKYQGTTKMDLEAKERFARAVIQARAGRSYRSFAKMLGVSHPTVKAWEDCVGNPDLENVEKIAVLLGQPLDVFRAYLENEPTRLQKLVAEINQIPKEDLPEILKTVAKRLEE